jgi:hypothetical protein
MTVTVLKQTKPPNKEKKQQTRHCDMSQQGEDCDGLGINWNRQHGVKY